MNNIVQYASNITLVKILLINKMIFIACYLNNNKLAYTIPIYRILFISNVYIQCPLASYCIAKADWIKLNVPFNVIIFDLINQNKFSMKVPKLLIN